VSGGLGRREKPQGKQRKRNKRKRADMKESNVRSEVAGAWAPESKKMATSDVSSEGGEQEPTMEKLRRGNW